MGQFDTQVTHKMKLSVKNFVQVSHEDAKAFDTVKLECYCAVMSREQVAQLRDLLSTLYDKMK